MTLNGDGSASATPGLIGAARYDGCWDATEAGSVTFSTDFLYGESAPGFGSLWELALKADSGSTAIGSMSMNAANDHFSVVGSHIDSIAGPAFGTLVNSQEYGSIVDFSSPMNVTYTITTDGLSNFTIDFLLTDLTTNTVIGDSVAEGLENEFYSASLGSDDCVAIVWCSKDGESNGGSYGSSVPEPSALLLLPMAGCFALLRRYRGGAFLTS